MGGEEIPKGQVHPGHVVPNPMNLAIHLQEQRQRALGLTPTERSWRKKWIQDQKLDDSEPTKMAEAIKPYNPIRKLYRIPFNALESKLLVPMLGWYYGGLTRKYITLTIWSLGITYAGWYYFKYKRMDWQSNKRWRVVPIEKYVYKRNEIEAEHPGLLETAFKPPQGMADFHDMGFKNRRAFMDLNLSPPQRP